MNNETEIKNNEEEVTTTPTPEVAPEMAPEEKKEEEGEVAAA